MKRPIIYLCGPIHGLNYDSAYSWRSEAERLLAPEFTVLNPLRGREFEGTDYSRYTDSELVTRDLCDIRASRAVLRFYEGASSEGSSMETFYASHVCGLPVVTFGSLITRADTSLWLRHHSVKNVASLKAAVEYLKTSWLNPDEQPEPPFNAREHLRSA